MGKLVAFLCLAIAVAVLWYFRHRLKDLILPRRKAAVSSRMLAEDALKHIYLSELAARRPTIQSVGGQLSIHVNQAAHITEKLQQRGLLRVENGEFQLTSSGRLRAQHLVRAHRLWERYLAETTAVPETDWHGKAELEEHRISPQEAEALAAQLGYPTRDPHGDPVPSATGELRPAEGDALLSFEVGQLGRIVHLEDEPGTLFSQLVKAGLHPGMEIRLLEVDQNNVRILVEGEERVLPLLAAGNVQVERLAEEERTDFSHLIRLSELELGGKATVILISPACRGLERRRFMDLGILPGTVVEVEMEGPSGDPRAYRIKEATIALRREQAQRVFVRKSLEAA